jgi:N-acetylglucosaminyl-diphospho-decaprenol L-rhamnosyltransferase
MNDYSNNITVSIVSHGHGSMVWSLLSQIIAYKEVKKVIITLNIPEVVPDNLPEKVLLIKNNNPKGFGENHNFAFTMATSDYYCVLNPDIVLIENPFPNLINIFANKLCGLVAPTIIDTGGNKEDTMRKHLSPWLLCKRVLGLDRNSYYLKADSKQFFPDWVAGMFMVFRSQAFNKLGGFDEGYFMYCEDADICRRLWKIGYQIVGCMTVNVRHNAQRASHRNLQHFLWHLKSLCRYFIKYRQ